MKLCSDALCEQVNALACVPCRASPSALTECLVRRTYASITIINVSTILQHVSYTSRIRDSSFKLVGTLTLAVARKGPNKGDCLIHLQSRIFPLQDNMPTCSHMLFVIRKPSPLFIGLACTTCFKCKRATYRPRSLPKKG